MLPKNEKEALVDVDDRIAMLERRLDNAKAARVRTKTLIS